MGAHRARRRRCRPRVGRDQMTRLRCTAARGPADTCTYTGYGDKGLQAHRGPKRRGWSSRLLQQRDVHRTPTAAAPYAGEPPPRPPAWAPRSWRERGSCRPQETNRMWCDAVPEVMGLQVEHPIQSSSWKEAAGCEGVGGDGGGRRNGSGARETHARQDGRRRCRCR